MPQPSFKFTHAQRIHGRDGFAAVYEKRRRVSDGPLSIYAIPNSLPLTRWGLSIGRPVGIAVKRNHIKRMLREAIRLTQHELPTGYDVVIVVRPHEPMSLPEYQNRMGILMAKMDASWAGKK